MYNFTAVDIAEGYVRRGGHPHPHHNNYILRLKPSFNPAAVRLSSLKTHAPISRPFYFKITHTLFLQALSLCLSVTNASHDDLRHHCRSLHFCDRGEVITFDAAYHHFGVGRAGVNVE